MENKTLDFKTYLKTLWFGEFADELRDINDRRKRERKAIRIVHIISVRYRDQLREVADFLKTQRTWTSIYARADRLARFMTREMCVPDSRVRIGFTSDGDFAIYVEGSVR